MKQADEQSRRLQKAQAQEFERRKQAILNAQPGKPQLWNAYGGDPNVVDLTGHEAGKPRLLRNPFHADGAPASGGLTEHERIRQFTEKAKYAHIAAPMNSMPSRRNTRGTRRFSRPSPA